MESKPDIADIERARALRYLLTRIGVLGSIVEPAADVKTILLAVPTDKRPELVALLEGIAHHSQLRSLCQAARLVLDAARELWGTSEGSGAEEQAGPAGPTRFRVRWRLPILVGAGMAMAFGLSVLAMMPAKSRLELSPPYVPHDGVTFSAGFERVTLRGVEAPSWRAVCHRRDGTLWACGLRAREALLDRIQNRPLSCEGANAGASPREMTCHVGGLDVARELVLGGWARGTAARYSSETALARKERVGLWSGEWPQTAPR